MGQALDRYAAFKSTGGEVFYVYADITWDSSFYVRVSNIRYSSSESTYYFKWRVSPRNNTANPVAGTDLGPKYEF